MIILHKVLGWQRIKTSKFLHYYCLIGLNIQLNYYKKFTFIDDRDGILPPSKPLPLFPLVTSAKDLPKAGEVESPNVSASREFNNISSSAHPLSSTPLKTEEYFVSSSISKSS